MQAATGEGATALVLGAAGSAKTFSTASFHDRPGNQGSSGTTSPDVPMSTSRHDAWQLGHRMKHASACGQGKARVEQQACSKDVTREGETGSGVCTMAGLGDGAATTRTVTVGGGGGTAGGGLGLGTAGVYSGCSSRMIPNCCGLGNTLWDPPCQKWRSSPLLQMKVLCITMMQSQHTLRHSFERRPTVMTACGLFR